VQQLLDALAHLGGSLVGEGHRQDRVQRGAFDLIQPGDPVHQYAGLARASASQYQLTAQRRGHGLALSIVEGIQEEREIVMHRGILLEMPALRSLLWSVAAPFRVRKGRPGAAGKGASACVRRSANVSFNTFSDVSPYDATLATCHYRPWFPRSLIRVQLLLEQQP
jgi:hypothetical protein